MQPANESMLATSNHALSYGLMTNAPRQNKLGQEAVSLRKRPFPNPRNYSLNGFGLHSIMTSIRKPSNSVGNRLGPCST